MKPIFKEEKEFLENNLNIKLPNNCWRDGSKILLNIDTKPAIVEFKAEGKVIKVKNNRIIEIKEGSVVIKDKKDNLIEIENLSYDQEYNNRENYLVGLINESVDKTAEYIVSNPNHELRESVSGGKDSDLLHYIVKKTYDTHGETIGNFEDVIIDVFNTTNDTAQTYLHIKQDMNIPIDRIHTPKKGWYRWLAEDKNYFLPSVNVRNCCSTFKEGKVKQLLDKKKNYIMLLGMRKHESQKRSHYDWDLNQAILKAGQKLNMPENWKRFLPIVNFKDEDVWLILLHENIKFNDMYRYGYNRCGCLLCPYASDYTDMLTRKHYGFLMDRWEEALEKNYDIYGVEKRLKWSLQEWKDGKWKQGTSKEMDLIRLKATPERIKEMADIKGISEEMAAKYFQRKCKCCDKSINPDDIAMNLKLFGRYEGQEDHREFMCKKHICEFFGWTSDEYGLKVREFRDQNCNLF